MARPKTTTTAPAAAVENAPNAANKSKAIRDYAAAHPNLRPTDIAAALKEQGIDVNSARVSSVLRNSAPKLSAGSIKAAASFVKAYKGKIADARTAIQSVGSFIDECGNATSAIEALDTFESISSAMQ